MPVITAIIETRFPSYKSQKNCPLASTALVLETNYTKPARPYISALLRPLHAGKTTMPFFAYFYLFLNELLFQSVFTCAGPDKCSTRIAAVTFSHQLVGCTAITYLNFENVVRRFKNRDLSGTHRREKSLTFIQYSITAVHSTACLLMQQQLNVGFFANVICQVIG